MFIGREKELSVLEKLYHSDKFEFLVVYGRRRVGKTAILKEFSQKHKTLFYSSLEKKSNMFDFSSCVLQYYNTGTGLSFDKWESIFSYIANQASEEKTVIIIDEFPYIVKEEPSVKSILQHTIDHLWENKNIMLVLCGSSVSFMVNRIMGKKSPLYGRNTAVMEVAPFDYSFIGKFLPHYTAEERLLTYGILGGVPYYLSQFSDKKSLLQNIADQIVDSSAPLREEPITLLKSELREPATYNSIMEAIASGATRLSEIAAKAGIDSTKASVYINNLRDMRLVDKLTPCGKKENGKISQYVISDNFFAFWYRFIFSQKTKMDLMDPTDFARDIMTSLSDYMGLIFEKICLQYIKAEARCGRLPFIPSKLGKWWGTNPQTHRPTDIDILGIDGSSYIFCECKFRNELFDLREFHDLLASADMYPKAKEKYFYVFVKSGFTDAVIAESRNYHAKLLTINDIV